MVLYLHIPYVFHYMKHIGQTGSFLYLNTFSNSLQFHSDYEFEG